MANVAHSTLTGADLHEPKGVASASSGDIYVANGAGSGAHELCPGRVYGGICSKDSSIAIGSIGTTPKQFTGYDTDMPSNGVTPAHGSDNITIVTAGIYFISSTITFETSAAGDAGTYQFHLRVNGTENPDFGTRRYMSGTSDVGSCTFSGIISLSASDVLTIYVESDDAGSDDIVVESAQFSVFLLKES